MIKWYEKIYMDEKVEKNPEKYIKCIENGKLSLGLYCITLASNDKNLFDIIETNELLFRHYKNNTIYIIGLAKGKDRAIQIVQDLILEVYQHTGGFKVREYYDFP